MSIVPGILALLAIATVLAGSWLIWSAFGRRGERPHCRGCGYDVASQLDAPQPICPECGQDLTGSQATVVGAKTLRRGRLLSGVTLLLLLVGAGIWRMTSGLTWYNILPNNYLIYLTASAPLDEALLAYAELEQRWGPDALSDHDFAEAGLNLHGRLPHLHTAWGELAMLGDAIQSHEATQAQWQRLADQAISQYRLHIRPTTQVGRRLPWQIDQLRGLPSPVLGLLVLDELTVNGETIARKRMLTATGGLGGSSRSFGQFPGRFEQPGVYEVTARFLIVLQKRPERGPLKIEGAGVFATSIPISKTVQVEVFEDEPVYVAPTPRHLGKLQNFRIRQMILEQQNRLVLTLDPQRDLEVPVAFDAFIDTGDGLQPLISAVDPNRPASFHFERNYTSHSWRISGTLADGDAQTGPFDILLASSAAHARQTATLTEIWDGGLLFEQVSLDGDPLKILPRILTPAEVEQRIGTDAARTLTPK